ncbi:MAG: hypothetical protein H0W33_12050 [Gammaproteobacteria bacterium]|nr:hypothetical protein [Gammaproteobacteria bacterium]
MAGRIRTGREDIPVLTDAVEVAEGETLAGAETQLDERRLAELHDEIVARAHTLAGEIAREALQTLEAPLLEQLSTRLQEELPELIGTLLRHRPDRAP